MKKTLAALGIAFLIGGAIYLYAAAHPDVVVSEPESEASVQAHFMERVKAKASEYKEAHPDANLVGFSGGFSGFLLIQAFPGLVPADFAGIQGRSISGESGGEYSERDGKLSFFGHAASDSANIPDSEMPKLLHKISTRLSMPVRSSADVDAIIARIAASQ
jgi:hypothetical protein